MGRKLRSIFSILDVRDNGTRHAEFSGDIKSPISFIEKALDFSYVIGRKLEIRASGFYGFKLLNRRVSIDTKTVGKSMTGDYGANRSFFKTKFGCDIIKFHAPHSEGVNVVNNGIGEFKVMRDTPNLEFPWFSEIVKRRVPVNAKEMTPSPARGNLICDVLSDTETFPNLGGCVSFDPEGIDFLSRRLGYRGRSGLLANPPTLAHNHIVNIIFGRSPSEMFRIAAGRVVARMERKKAQIRRFYTRHQKRDPIRPHVFTFMVEHAVSSFRSACRPFPAIIRSFNVNLGPKAFFGFFHGSYPSINSCNRIGLV